MRIFTKLGCEVEASLSRVVLVLVMPGTGTETGTGTGTATALWSSDYLWLQLWASWLLVILRTGKQVIGRPRRVRSGLSTLPVPP